MKRPPHMHSVGEFWVWSGTSQCRWFASPKGSGASRDASVCISGLKGRPGSVAKRIGTRRWLVTVPHHNPGDGCTVPDEYTVVASSRRKALMLGEIYQQYGRPVTPYLTTVDGVTVAVKKILGSEVRGIPTQWLPVLPQGRRVRRPR